MSTKRYRAVILDDNSTIRKVLRSFFDSLGYEVFTFPDLGLCPLHVIHTCPCPPSARCADLIVSDLRMLDGSGVDFLEQLVRKGCRHPPLALMSGDFSGEDLARASRLGCMLFKKPLDMVQFATWVKEAEGLIPSTRALHDWLENSPAGDIGSHP